VAVNLQAVTVRRGEKILLNEITWEVSVGERWAILGANGAGKTTLLKVIYGEFFPTTGTASILGHRLGHVDLRKLRQSIGLTGAFLEASFRPEISAAEAVMSAKHAARETWWHRYSKADESKAQELLGLVGCGHLAAASLGDCSSGERQRILLARALMPQPQLLILDEPMANLDVAGREQLLGVLAAESNSGNAGASIYSANPNLTSLLVTHHTEEIPSSTTHLLLLKDGRTIASGKIDQVFTQENLSLCFGLKLSLEHSQGRWRCWATV